VEPLQEVFLVVSAAFSPVVPVFTSFSARKKEILLMTKKWLLNKIPLQSLNRKRLQQLQWFNNNSQVWWCSHKLWWCSLNLVWWCNNQAWWLNNLEWWWTLQQAWWFNNLWWVNHKWWWTLQQAWWFNNLWCSNQEWWWTQLLAKWCSNREWWWTQLQAWWFNNLWCSNRWCDHHCSAFDYKIVCDWIMNHTKINNSKIITSISL